MEAVEQTATSFLTRSVATAGIIRITALWEYDNKKYVQGYWYLSNRELPPCQETDARLDPNRELVASDVLCEMPLSKVTRKCFVLTLQQWLLHMSSASSSLPDEDLYWCVRFRRSDGEVLTLPICRKRKRSDSDMENIRGDDKQRQSEYADCVVAHTKEPNQYFVRWLVSSPSLQPWQDAQSINDALLSRFQRNTHTHVTLPLRLLLSGFSPLPPPPSKRAKVTSSGTEFRSDWKKAGRKQLYAPQTRRRAEQQPQSEREDMSLFIATRNSSGGTTTILSQHREVITPTWRLLYWCDEEDVDNVYSRYFSRFRDQIPHRPKEADLLYNGDSKVEQTTENIKDNNSKSEDNDDGDSSEDTCDEYYEKLHDRTNDNIKKRFISALATQSQ